MAQFEINNYSPRIWSSRSTTNLSPGTAVAGIYLYHDNQYRGYVYFFPDGTALAPPVYHSSSGRIFLHLNMSQFGPVLEMLRTEKPIFLYYNSPTNAALRCGVEPTGEEE